MTWEKLLTYWLSVGLAYSVWLKIAQQRTAGNYGTRKRSGGVSALICAVLDDRHTEDDEPRSEVLPRSLLILDTDTPSRYSTFVRIGSGLSFADYVWIRQKHWKEWDPKNPPEFLRTAKRTHEDKGDVYIEPAEYASGPALFSSLSDILAVPLY